jgi:hypothetical protein
MVCDLQKHDGRVWAQVTLALNLRQPGKNTAIDLTINKAAGKAASKYLSSPIAKSVTTKAGRLNNSGKALVKATGNNVTRKTTATVKKVAENTGKAAARTAETGAKGYANPHIQKGKDKTDM